MDICLQTYHQKKGEEWFAPSENHLLQVVKSGCVEIVFFYDEAHPVTIKAYSGAYFYTPPLFPEFKITWKNLGTEAINLLNFSFDKTDIFLQKVKLPDIELQPADGIYDNLVFSTMTQLSQIKNPKKDVSYVELLNNTLLFQLYQSNLNIHKNPQKSSKTLLNLYINQNLDRKIAIEELANLLGMSKFHFIRQFKTIYGTTPLQYIKKIRLEKAQNLLIQSDKNISEIAYEVGYQTLSRFSEDFKSFTELSPSAFRSHQQ